MKKSDLMKGNRKGKCAIVVAHPGDETLWAGGLLSMLSDLNWYLIALWGGRDSKLSQCFLDAAADYGATAILGKLYEPENSQPMATITVERAIMELLPSDQFEIIVTHALWGEYTRNLRNEEVGHAIQFLHHNNRLNSSRLLCFAYEDHDGQTLPEVDTDADIQWPLPDDIWRRKRKVLNSVYGYTRKSWQYQSAPKTEAYWNCRLYTP